MCRAHSSGWGCQIILFTLERRSCLRGTGHGPAISSWDSPEIQLCFFSRAGPLIALCVCVPWLAWLPGGSERLGERCTRGGWAIRGPTHPCSSKNKWHPARHYFVSSLWTSDEGPGRDHSSRRLTRGILRRWPLQSQLFDCLREDAEKFVIHTWPGVAGIGRRRRGEVSSRARHILRVWCYLRHLSFNSLSSKAPNETISLTSAEGRWSSCSKRMGEFALLVGGKAPLGRCELARGRALSPLAPLFFPHKKKKKAIWVRRVAILMFTQCGHLHGVYPGRKSTLSGCQHYAGQSCTMCNDGAAFATTSLLF